MRSHVYFEVRTFDESTIADVTNVIFQTQMSPKFSRSFVNFNHTKKILTKQTSYASPIHPVWQNFCRIDYSQMVWKIHALFEVIMNNILTEMTYLSPV